MNPILSTEAIRTFVKRNPSYFSSDSYKRGVEWACARKDSGKRTSSTNAWDKVSLFAGNDPEKALFWTGVAEASGAFNGVYRMWAFFSIWTPKPEAIAKDRARYWQAHMGVEFHGNPRIHHRIIFFKDKGLLNV